MKRRRSCARPPVGSGSAMTIHADGSWTVSNNVPWTEADTALLREWVMSGRWARFAPLRGAIATVWHNRRLRREHAEDFEAEHEAVRAMRKDFADANWPAWAHACKRFEIEVLRLTLAYHKRFAEIGKKVAQAAGTREKDRDREDFLRIARGILDLKRDLAPAALRRDPTLSAYVREYPERVKVWTRKLYPRRPRGRPATKKK